MKTITKIREKCDRCSAQAQHKASKISYITDNKELYFCGHHKNVHFEQLIATGWTVENMEM